MKNKAKEYRGWLEEFLISLDDRGYSDNTVRTYGIYLRKFFGFIEARGLDLKKIGHRDIRAFLGSLKKTLSRASF